jgi:hypothetical protein
MVALVQGGARPQGCSGNVVLRDRDNASARFVESAEPDYGAAAAVGEKFPAWSKGDGRSSNAAVSRCNRHHLSGLLVRR